MLSVRKENCWIEWSPICKTSQKIKENFALNMSEWWNMPISHHCAIFAIKRPVGHESYNDIPSFFYPKERSKAFTRRFETQWAESDLCMQTFLWQHHRNNLSQDTKIPGQLRDKSLERGIGPHTTTNMPRKAKGGRKVNL